MLNRLFKLDQHGTTVARELQAGATTFAAMAYILAVNPAILANTGMDRGALVTVTALTAALATLLMAWLTNYPIAMAPGMGINAFFTFTICGVHGVSVNSPFGRYLRDAQAYEVAGGSVEILRNTIGKYLLKDVD